MNNILKQIYGDTSEAGLQRRAIFESILQQQMESLSTPNTSSAPNDMLATAYTGNRSRSGTKNQKNRTAR